MNTTALKQSVYESNMTLHRLGLVLYTWGNVSQIDRERDIVAIKPSGVPYETLTPDDIVILRASTGDVTEGALNPSSDAPTHLALYRAFPEIGGVTHTHSTYATAWAQAGMAIPELGTTHADYFHGPVPVTRYVSPEETERGYEAETGTVIIEAFAGKNPLHTPGALVRGHGPFTWGTDAANSVYNARVLEEVAKMASLTLALNPAVQPLARHIAEKHFSRKHGPHAYYGQR